MLIGLHGEARSGKSTAANYLVENYSFQEYAFAKPMKDFLMELFQWEKKHVYGELKEVVDKRWGFTPRAALQILGTEFGRRLNPDMWLIMAEDALSLFDENKHIVISDVRFENEANFVRKRGVLWHIVRPNPDQINGVGGHASEQGIVFKSGDIRIVNDGKVDQFLLKIKTRMEMLKL